MKNKPNLSLQAPLGLTGVVIHSNDFTGSSRNITTANAHYGIVYRWLNKLLMIMLLSISYSCLATEAIHTFNTPNDQERYQTLINEVRCVVCQGQSIADSNALLAQDLRAKIYRMINAHQSDDEIKDYLAARYGEFILLQPRLNKTSILLWVFPFLGLGIIFLLGLRHVRRSMLK